MSKYMPLALCFLAVAAATFRVAACGTTMTLSCFLPGSPSRVVAGPGLGQWNHTETGFGTINVFDSLMTATPDPKSTYLGQARGFLVFNAVGGNSIVDLLMLDFENDQFNGSVSLFGTENLRTKSRVVPIAGGSGDFLFIKGYSLVEPMIPTHRKGVVFWVHYNVTLVYKKAASLDDF